MTEKCHVMQVIQPQRTLFRQLDIYICIWETLLSKVTCIAFQVHILSVHAFPWATVFELQEWYEQVDGLTNMKSLNKLYSNYLFIMYLTLKRLALQLCILSVHTFFGNQTCNNTV